MTRSRGCTWTKRSRNPILHAVSPVSQNLSTESLNQFISFYRANMLHLDTLLIFEIITEGCHI